jgi:putative DNA primase/helicase
MGDVVELKKDRWDMCLIKNKQGAYLPCLGNVVGILTHHEDWRDVIAFDAFAGRPIKMNKPPWYEGTAPDGEELGDWTRADSSRAAVWITREYNCAVQTHTVEEAIPVVAELWTVHPVRDWLNKLGPTWDRKGRADDFLIRLAGAKDTPYTRAVTKNFFLSAVARIFQPGCKVDAMLILEGEQDSGKSTLFRTLVGDEWFFDSAFDPGSKDSYQALRRKWVLEWAELDGLNRTEISRVKAFMSSPKDTYRPSYAKQTIDVPRQCVFVGTVNPDGAGYLNDPTGDRRFWPVNVGKVDLKKVKAEREQLWAEAVIRYRQGEKWYLRETRLVGAAAKEAEERRIRDPWEADAQAWLKKNDRAEKGVTTEELLSKAIGMPKDRRTRADQMRMARVLRVIGWTVVKRSSANGLRRYFPKGTAI